MKKTKQQKTPSNQALLLFYSWLETKLTKWVHLSPGVVIVFSPRAAPAAHYRVFRSDWCVWGWFGARGRHWVLSLRGHPGLEVMTEPGDLRVRIKFIPCSVAGKTHSKFILFSANREFFSQCTILCPKWLLCEPHTSQGQFLPVCAKEPNSALQNSSDSPGTQLTRSPSCLYLFTPWTPKFKANCCNSFWNCNLCVTRCKYTQWVAHRGLPGEHFSIKPFQKSVPRQDYTDSFLQGVTHIL